VAGMPSSAVERGAADFILPPEQIVAHLRSRWAGEASNAESLSNHCRAQHEASSHE
jgi:hypothetical protein